MTPHTVDTRMALAYKIRDARTYEWDVSEAVAPHCKGIRTTLALAPKSHNTNSLRQDGGRCGLCGGDWSVCGCQGMVNRKSLPQAALPVQEAPLLRQFLDSAERDGVAHFSPPVAQPVRVPLSEERIIELGHRMATKYTHTAPISGSMYGFSKIHIIDFVRAIECEHGIGTKDKEQAALQTAITKLQGALQ